MCLPLQITVAVDTAVLYFGGGRTQYKKLQNEGATLTKLFVDTIKEQFVYPALVVMPHIIMLYAAIYWFSEKSCSVPGGRQ